jgi:hypothetical protein
MIFNDSSLMNTLVHFDELFLDEFQRNFLRKREFQQKILIFKRFFFFDHSDWSISCCLVTAEHRINEWTNDETLNKNENETFFFD